MSSLLGWVVVVSLLVGVAGGLFFHSLEGFAGGLLLGILFSTRVWIREIASILMPDSFVTYASDSTSESNSNAKRYLDIQLWTDKTTSQWLRLGLTDEEWRGLAISINDSQSFSTDTIDRKWYAKVKQRFEEVGLIQPGGRGGGYELTTSGKKVFKHLATLPYPYTDVPELIKQLDTSPSPQ